MSIIITPSLYGVVGFPLGHSLSPLMHNTAFRELGITAVFLPWSVGPDKISVFIEAVRLLNIRGVSVTIPHKTSIIPLLDRVTDRVKATGATNLIYWEGEILCGDNVDMLGFMSPLEATLSQPHLKKVLLLGAGGAARAVVAGLKALGLKDITITDIVIDLMAALVAEDGDLKTVPWDERANVPADIVINATPLGMKGKFENQTAYPAEAFQGRQGVAYDVVYTPFVTRFQREAAAAGWKTIPGWEMFIAQGNHAFHAWTGHNLPEAAKQVVFDALNAQ